MRPATRYVMRSSGCGRLLGFVLIALAIVILVLNSGLGISWNYRRWWPVLIIAFGVYLLVRGFWLRFSHRSALPDVIDVGRIARLGGRREWWRPSGLAVVVIAIGVCWLVVNLGTPQWVIWVIVLAALGLLLLGGSVRASFQRS